MALRLRTVWMEGIPRPKPRFDLRADPSFRNYIWYPWVENDEKGPEVAIKMPSFPLQISIGELQYLVDINFNTFKDNLNMYIKNMGEAFVKSISGLFSF